MTDINAVTLDQYIYDEIKIRKNQQEFDFIKTTENIWTTTANAPERIDTQALTDLKDTLDHFSYKEIISINPQKYSYYKVTDETALVVSLFYQKKMISKYYIGRNNPNYNTTFIRKNNDPSIYQENGLIQDRFKPEKSDWVLNGLPPVATDNINIIMIKFPTRSFTYTLDKNNNWITWKKSTNNIVPTKLMDVFSTISVSSSLSPTRSNEIVPAKFTYSVTFKKGDAVLNNYQVYLLDNVGVYVKCDRFVYKIYDNIYPISSANYYIDNS